MAWEFDKIVQFAQQFVASGREDFELGFVFSEWTPADGLTLTETYPAVREDVAPTEDAPAGVANRIWVKLNNGAWQQLSGVAQVTNIGIGTVGVLTSGIESTMVIKGWTSKSIAAGYIIAPTVTMNQINADRTTGLALIRVQVAGDTHPLAPSEPFTSGQVSVLSTWLNEHDITNAEFAALFNVAPAYLANWLQNNPRWRFAQVIHDRFNGSSG